MATAREVAISRGPWPDANRDDAFEFLFDDDSQSRFVLHTVPESLDRLPAKADEGRGDLACLVYTGAMVEFNSLIRPSNSIRNTSPPTITGEMSSERRVIWREQWPTSIKL